MEKPFKLLKSAWSLYKANWKVLTLIVAAPMLVVNIGSFLNAAGQGAIQFIGALIVIAGAVMGVALAPASAVAVQRIEKGEGQSVTFANSYKAGFAVFWAFLSVSILRALIAGVLSVLILIPIIIISAYNAFYVLTLSGLSALFLISTIIIIAYTVFYVFTIVIDGKRGWEAFTESYAIVKGRWWPTLWRIVFLMLVTFVVLFITGNIQSGINLIFGFTKGSGGYFLVNALMLLIQGSIVGSVSVAYLYKLYENMKSTREQNVQTKTFKIWLIVLMCVGIVAIVVTPIFAVMYIAKNGILGVPAQEFTEELNKCGQDQKCAEDYVQGLLCAKYPTTCKDDTENR